MIRLFADGHSHKTAADSLGVGFETTKTQTRILRRKLGARTTTHAVAIAIRYGLVE